MLRVLKPGGTVAFSTWPPELFTGRFFAFVAKYAPPPPSPAPAPTPLWGNPDVVRERLGAAVVDLHFRSRRHGGAGPQPAAPPDGARVDRRRAHARGRALAPEPDRLAALRREIDALLALYFDDRANVVRQDFLMTRATKAR